MKERENKKKREGASEIESEFVLESEFIFILQRLQIRQYASFHLADKN